MFNPLPAIALLPLALLWFGLGNGSLVFVLIHSVLWVVALNTHAGFRGVSATLRMVGRNYGLRGLALRARDPDPGGVPEHPDRAQGRLGVRLAHADRGRAGVRRVVGRGRARLVHLREQEPARDPGRVRRAADGDPDRAGRREPGVPHGRGAARSGAGACSTELSRWEEASNAGAGPYHDERHGRRAPADGGHAGRAAARGDGEPGAAPARLRPRRATSRRTSGSRRSASSPAWARPARRRGRSSSCCRTCSACPPWST